MSSHLSTGKFVPIMIVPPEKEWVRFYCNYEFFIAARLVGPQEYTLIKLLVVQPYPPHSPLNNERLQGKLVFLAPATLRPETMYGQTNCFVLPEGDYGAYEIVTGEVLIISHRAALGLAHQGFMAEWGKAEPIIHVKGQDLLGLPLKAPNAVYERVYTLPLITISMGKGTGVVTSVPSDAPDGTLLSVQRCSIKCRRLCCSERTSRQATLERKIRTNS